MEIVLKRGRDGIHLEGRPPGIRESGGYRSILLGSSGCPCHDKSGPVRIDIRLDHQIFDQVDALIYDGLRTKTVSLRILGPGESKRLRYTVLLLG